MKATRLVSVMMVFVLFSVCGFAQPPEIEWSRTYGRTNTDDYTAAVLPTPDGGYLLCGSTFPRDGASVWDFLVVKTNANGDSLWSKTYGTSHWEECWAAQAAIDGGFVLAGFQISESTVGFDFVLLKIDAQGDSLWCRTYGRYAHDYCLSVLPTADGGYLMAGATADFETGIGDGWLVKTDANGDSLWSRIYGGSDGDEIWNIQPATNSGYVLAGTTGAESQTGPRFWMQRINDTGDSLWSRIYGGPNIEHCLDVRQTSDGGYVLAGRIYLEQPINIDFYLLKTDADGDSLWSRTYGGDNSNDYCRTVLQTTDGGYILIGQMLPTDTYNYDGLVIRTDADGDSLWSMRMSVFVHDYFSDVLQLADGGYILGGYSFPEDTTTTFPSNMWLVKLAPEMFADEMQIPRSTCLLTNYPNPFNSATQIEFTLPTTQRVSLRLYDVLGREVAVLVNEIKTAGEHRVMFNAAGLASGVYLCRIEAERFVQTRKLALIR